LDPFTVAARFIQPWIPFRPVFLCGGERAAYLVLVYLKTPQLQTAQNLLICNLSAIDSMVALLGIPFSLFNYTGLAFSLHHGFACLFGVWMASSIFDGVVFNDKIMQ
jgi:hypothetical protein